MNPTSTEAGSAWQPPLVIDEFVLVRPLGHGAMGQVFLGQDTQLDRPVAVKFILASHPDLHARQLFLNEARAIARLQHPNVVTLYRVGEVEGHPFLVSELIRGVSLSDIDKPVPWAKALDLAIDAARGLAAAHRQGVLHRDIKPANMMLTNDGQVKLLDFGLATFADAHVAVDAALDPTLALVSGPTQGVVGTPLYMAPEVRRGEPATRRSDVYSLGCVIYELCVGRAPLLIAVESQRAGPDTLASGTQDDLAPDDVAAVRVPPLAETAPEVDGSFAAVIDRCLAVETEHRFASSEEVWDALETLRSTGGAGRGGGDNPYRGLLPFEEEHRALFFGRSAETRAILERLRSEPLLILAGGSGSGKTSLCRAGVLPLLSAGTLGDGHRWVVAGLTPRRFPLRGLAVALCPILGQPEDEILEGLGADPRGVARALRRHRHEARVLLFIDQLEELFTLAPPAEAAAVGEFLAALGVLSAAVRVLLSIRTDLLPRLLMLSGIGAQVSQALHLLRPLGPEDVREIVVGPARRCGVRFESEILVATLVSAAQETAGGLSQLQFALTELWRRRDVTAGVITAAALDGLGGVTGALARHADGVLRCLDEAGRSTARRILSRLVDREGQRLHRTRAELCPDEAGGDTLESLVRGRLVVAAELGGETLYELAHDALLVQWGTLRAWLEERGEGGAARRRIEAAAAEWERLGRPAEALWQARQLLDAAAVQEVDLWPREVAFLAASRRAVRRRRIALASLPVLLLVGLLGAKIASRRAIDQAVAAHVNLAVPMLRAGQHAAAAALSLRTEALARFDQAELPEAEAQWEQSQQLIAKAEQGYVAANQELEAALILDLGDRRLRALIAEVTYERVRLTELTHRAGTRDELLRHLATYDEAGDLVARLRAPARLVLTSQPEGAVVRLYKAGARGYALSRELGRTPLSELSIPAGSWLLSFVQPGSAPAAAALPVEVPGERARLPLLLVHGERREVSVALPDRGQLPAGFVYIPAGEFLYGSADDEALRRGFLHAQPMHVTRTAAYLISRTEVTFGEWLAFLRELPPAQRARRAPQGGNLHGHLLLQELPGGAYRLRIRPLTQEYVALEGEPIRYRARPLRAQQDWRRMPVSAISLEDARAYAAWLDRTGRVPGARLCDEREWERAARGADARHFPHGDQLLPDDADFDETYRRDAGGFGPDEVGAHPASASPFGVLDMTGNVWELTTEVGHPQRVVLRGGGWYYDQLTNWLINREPLSEMPVREMLLGLRLCAAAPAGL